jgi:O-antigen/teichoic acid export membrane protein
LPSYLSGLLVSPATWAASALLVNQPSGFTQMALFSAADRFRYLLIFLPLAASRIAIPALSRQRAAGDQRGFAATFRWTILFGLLTTAAPALACVALSSYLMGWFGADFRAGWVTLSVLAISAIPTVINTQLGSALLSSDRAWTRMAADALLTVVLLAMAWILIPRWGAVGLATAFAAAYSVACCMMAVCLRRPDANA